MFEVSCLLCDVYTLFGKSRSCICFRIGEVIDEDVLHARVSFVARTQQCFAVKAGIDGLLDIARRSFCDTSEGVFFLHMQLKFCPFPFMFNLSFGFLYLR